MATGIAGLIDRCELSCGDVILQSTPEFGVYHTMRRSFKTPESRALKDYVLEGTTADRVAFDSDGKVCLRDISYPSQAGAGVAGSLPAFVKPLTVSSGNTQYRLTMGDLFPAFSARQLPLFALNQHVLITLHLKPQDTASQVGNVLCFPAGHAGATTYSIDAPNCSFLYDSIAFNSESVEALLQQVNSPQGKSFVYSDMILTRITSDAVGAPVSPAVVVQDVDREIAVAGRTVRSLAVFDRRNNSAPEVPFMGQYASFVSQRPDEVQLVVNDKQVFQSRLISDTQKRHQLNLSVGDVKLQCHPLLYSSDPITDKSTDDRSIVGASAISSATIAGHDQSLMLASKHYMGINLEKGGSNELGNGLLCIKPMVLQRRLYRTSLNYQALESLAFTQVERVATMQAGMIVASV
jgi:hypothetical protein